jgi:hypothetical protein
MGTRGSFPWGVKRLEREADYSPPSSAKVKMCGAMPPLPKYAFMVWYSVLKNTGTTLPFKKKAFFTGHHTPTYYFGK